MCEAACASLEPGWTLKMLCYCRPRILHCSKGTLKPCRSTILQPRPAGPHTTNQQQKSFLAHRLPMSSQQQQQQQNKRVAEEEGGEHSNGAKRSRAPNGEVKLEQYWQGGEEAGQGAEGEEGVLVAVAQAMEEPQINIRLPVSHLHCHACVLPLKPPTFECEAGHVVCRACRGSHAQACAGAGTYINNGKLDGIVRDAMVPCVYETFGCTSWPVYHEAPEHHRSCRFAPCSCPVPGCGHFASPARLAEHFTTRHDWDVTKIDYATPYKLEVPALQDKLVLVGKADGAVFLVSPCAVGATAVSLVCVRACGDAAAGAPQYTCKLWAEVAGKVLLLTSDVASSDLAGGFPATDDVMYLALPRLLHGESGEPPALMVRIDKVGASIGRSRSPAAATPPSSTPRRILSAVMRIGS